MYTNKVSRNLYLDETRLWRENVVSDMKSISSFFVIRLSFRFVQELAIVTQNSSEMTTLREKNADLNNKVQVRYLYFRALFSVKY